MKIPVVTIVGRPNVGKSTFFNVMAGSRIAITDEVAGTTRDRIFYKVETDALDFFLVDTGGIEVGSKMGVIEENIKLQAKMGVEEADLILFMVSGNEPLTRDDFAVADLLRKEAGHRPIRLIVSKCDNPVSESEKAEFYQLGVGEPLFISSAHSYGIRDVKKTITASLKSLSFLTKDMPAYKEAMKADQIPQIALVGKPNVGKSSLINAFLNQPKLIVSPVPGTTRDSTDTIVTAHKNNYNFIDTAGLRRQSKVDDKVEKFNTLRTLLALGRCDIAVLVLDSTQLISHQDKRITQLILEAKKGIVILVNKWDIKVNPKLTEEERQKNYIEYLKGHFAFLSWAPVMFVSAETKKNLSLLFGMIDHIMAERQKRIKTPELNRFLKKIMAVHQPSGAKKIKPKIRYVTQVGTNPPNFIFFVNKKKYLHFSYLRFLENQLRQSFGFGGTPIDINLSERPSERDS